MMRFTDDFAFWVVEIASSDNKNFPAFFNLFFYKKGRISKNAFYSSKSFELNFPESDIKKVSYFGELEIDETIEAIQRKADGFPLFVFANQELSPFLQENGLQDFLWICRSILPFLTSHSLESLSKNFGLTIPSSQNLKEKNKFFARLTVKILDYVQDKFTPELCKLMHDFGKEGGVHGIDFLDEMSGFLLSQSILTKSNLSKYQEDINYFEHIVSEEKKIEIDDFFEENGLLSKKFDFYQVRKSQIMMAENVLDAFENGRILLAEAGTGTGKSLAYLVPSIIYSKSTDKQVVISTNTMNLQRQLMTKDLPVLVDSLPINFKACLLKGRSNYLCLSKFNQQKNDSFDLSESEFAQMFLILPWIWFTNTGDISYHSGFSQGSRLWSKICSDSNFCTNRKCSFYKDCYLYKAKALAKKSDLVIVNHSLLVIELLLGMPTLNSAENFVIDEAHNFHGVALSHLGLQISYWELSKFFDSIHNKKNKFQKGIVPLIKSKLVGSSVSADDKKEFENVLQKLIEEVSQISSVEDFYRELFLHFKDNANYGKFRLKKMIAEKALAKSSQDFQRIFSDLLLLCSLVDLQDKATFVDYDTVKEKLKNIKEECQNYLLFFTTLMNPDYANNCLWLSGGESFYSLSVNYTPIQIDQKIKEILYDRAESLIFCSATIALRGKFDFFSTKMGLNLVENQNRVAKQLFNSPFDYEKQSKVFVASGLDLPGTKTGEKQIFSNIVSILHENEVGSLILFTSLSDVRKARDFLGVNLQNRLILSQDGSKSRESLLEEFRDTRTSILLATNSFWEGIDIAGESLQLLILYKLPFAVPTDPLVEANLEYLQNESKNSFTHYMLPNALLKYKQGFGRLIRSKSDNGVLVSYDNRIFTKSYGNYFKIILPTKSELVDYKELPSKIKQALSEEIQ